MEEFQKRRLGGGKTQAMRSLEGQVREMESTEGFHRGEQTKHICTFYSSIRGASESEENS